MHTLQHAQGAGRQPDNSASIVVKLFGIFGIDNGDGEALGAAEKSSQQAGDAGTDDEDVLFSGGGGFGFFGCLFALGFALGDGDGGDDGDNQGGGAVV